MNDKESMQLIHVGFDRINQLVEDDQLDLDHLADLLSGSIHLNDPDTLSLDYIDHKTLQKIDMSIDDIRLKGFEFLKDIIEPSNLTVLLKMFDAYRRQSELDAPLAFFQHYRFNEKQEYNWMCTILKYNQRLDKLFCIDFNAKQFDVYSNKMQRLIQEDAFKNNHFLQYHSLTKREKEILRLISLGESNQKISDLLFLSKDTVRTHRNHIWRKLQINNLVDAIKYAQAFDLI